MKIAHAGVVCTCARPPPDSLCCAPLQPLRLARQVQDARCRTPAVKLELNAVCAALAEANKQLQAVGKRPVFPVSSLALLVRLPLPPLSALPCSGTPAPIRVQASI